MRVHERVGGAPRALHRPAVCVERDREELQREPLPDSIALLWIRRKYFEGRTINWIIHWVGHQESNWRVARGRDGLHGGGGFNQPRYHFKY